MIIGAPLVVALCIYPVFNGDSGLKMTYGTSIAIFLVVSAYMLVSEAERSYKMDKTVKLVLSTCFPMENKIETDKQNHK